MKIPTFTTTRLVLKEITDNDFASYEKHFIDYEVIRYLTATIPWPYPNGGFKDYFERTIKPHLGKDKWLWGIFLKSSPHELIGAIELRRKEEPDNRGFWLGRHFWGRGIMTEALVPITNYAFNALNFDKLTLTNATGNHSSHRIKEKTGARFLYNKPAEFVDPEFKEHEVWELTKKSWHEINR